MKITTILVLMFFTFNTFAQNLDKLRTMCIDDVDLSSYKGDLSKDQLKKQVHEIGYQYIEDGDIKFHNELIVYDCNSGNVLFTAEFDKNRLKGPFNQFVSEDVPAKELNLSKTNENQYVDLALQMRGNKIPAFPVGEAKIYESGTLKYLINFPEGDAMPTLKTYEGGKLSAKGNAKVNGALLQDWTFIKTGEWNYYSNGSVEKQVQYDFDGNPTQKQVFKNKSLIEETIYEGNQVTTKTYYANGNLKSEEKRVSGEKNGEWNYYNNEGTLVRSVNYIDGSIISERKYSLDDNLLFEKELIAQGDLKKNFKELNQPVYSYVSYYKNGKIKSTGKLLAEQNIGILESFTKNGKIKSIEEYDTKGELTRKIDAKTYQKIKSLEKEFHRELLVAQVTQPQNLNLEKEIIMLSDSLGFDSDSLLFGNQYKTKYENKLNALEKEAIAFEELNTDLEYLASLRDNAQEFADYNWVYSHDLHETELYLYKELATRKINAYRKKLKEEYTTEKKTLFGTRLEVVNDREKTYESVSEEIIPSIQANVDKAIHKGDIKSSIRELDVIIKKFDEVVNDPSEDFEDNIDRVSDIEDKKSLFLSAK